MFLKALRISQNGPPGKVFEADGERARMLVKNGIAEEFDQEAEARKRIAAEQVEAEPVGQEAEARKRIAAEQVEAEPVDPDADLLDSPDVKGGPQAKDATPKKKKK